MFSHQFAMKFSKLDVKWIKTSSNRGQIPKSFHPTTPLLLRHMLWRNKTNMNTIIGICGQVRTGKSACGLRIGEKYAIKRKLPYSWEKNGSFEILPFLEWSKTATDDVYVLDEIQKSVPSHLWYTVQSQIFNNFIDTQGFRKNVLIMTLPNLKTLLTRIQLNINYVIETQSQGIGWLFKRNVDNRRGKVYDLYLGAIKWDLPSKEIWDSYQKEKFEWNDRNLEADIQTMKNPDLNKKSPFSQSSIEWEEPVWNLKT